MFLSFFIGSTSFTSIHQDGVRTQEQDRQDATAAANGGTANASAPAAAANAVPAPEHGTHGTHGNPPPHTRDCQQRPNVHPRPDGSRTRRNVRGAPNANVHARVRGTPTAHRGELGTDRSRSRGTDVADDVTTDVTGRRWWCGVPEPFAALGRNVGALQLVGVSRDPPPRSKKQYRRRTKTHTHRKMQRDSCILPTHHKI